MITIEIAKDFSTTPGGRFKKDGKFSGEEFRERFLDRLFQDPNDMSKIVVVLDGVEGFATSFLDEAFGQLARKFSKERVLSRLDFVSEEDPLLPDEIRRYIQESYVKK